MAGLQGKIFSGYQLAEQVNGGGIADVYRAQPTNRGGRPAIVKVIHPEFARQKGFLPHFREIVKLSQRLANHPHILPLLASGEEGGYLYLVTPFVSSGTLKDWIARGERLSPSDTGPFFRQLCDALGYAHSLGIVHGNIKPSNIFLFEGRHVLLGDFGMLWDIGMLREFAQMDAAHSAEAVEYLAPEVASSQPTHLSDIYSVGAVLCAAVTGQAPFRGATIGEVLAAHERQPAPHLQQINPRLAPGMQALDVVAQRALAKRPDERFPSAAALSQAIESVLTQAQSSPVMGGANYSPAVPPAFGSREVMGLAQPGPRPPAQARLAGPAGAAMESGLSAATPGLPALSPPFPPLPSSAMVDGTMEHGRVNLNPNPTEAPTSRSPSLMSPRPPEPSDQSTVHVPAPVPPPDPPHLGGSRAAPPSAWPEPPMNVAPVWSNAVAGEASMLPAIRPQDFESRPVRRDLVSGPGSPLGIQPGSRQLYDAPGDSALLGGWDQDGAEDDSGGWDQYRAERYTSGNQRGSYPEDSGSPYYASESRRSEPEYPTSEYTAEREGYHELAGESSEYRSANEWGDGYTGEYTGGTIGAGEDSRELDSWTNERAISSRREPDERGFSPTQLGLPRLTNPSLGADLPSAWQDIVSGALPPPAPKNGWERVQPHNDPPGPSGWNDAPGYSESLSAYPPQVAEPQSPGWPPTEWAESTEWANMGAGNRRSPGTPLVPFEEQRVWTTGTSAVRHGSRWAVWLLPILILLAVAGSGLVVVQRPDLCPVHVCQTISNKAHKALPFLGVGSAKPAPNLTASLTANPLHVVSGKTANTTLNLTNAGPGVAHWTAVSGFSWLTLDTTSGSLNANQSATLTVTAASTGLHSGANTAEITITAASQAPLIIPVTVILSNS